MSKESELFDPETGEVFDAPAVVSVNAETGEEKGAGLMLSREFKMDWDKLEKAKPQPSIAPKYIEFDAPGTKLRGVYIGKQRIEKKEDDGTFRSIKVVVILTKDGAFMNGGVSLYDTITKFFKEGDALEIEYTGKKKAGAGNMKEYAVRPLSV